MNYEFLNSSIEKDNIILPNSDKINSFLLKNNYSEIIKAVDKIITIQASSVSFASDIPVALNTATISSANSWIVTGSSTTTTG